MRWVAIEVERTEGMRWRLFKDVLSGQEAGGGEWSKIQGVWGGW
jgi:hypothetical protein